MTRSFRRSVLLIYSSSFLQGAYGVTFPASSVYLRERLALGDTLYGALFLPGLLLALVTSLFGYALLRRWSLKSLFLFALGSEAVVLGLMALAGFLGRPLGLPVLLAAMFLQGPAMGAMGISINTAAIELFPNARGGALSVLHGLLGAGAAIWPLAVVGSVGIHAWAAAPLALAAAFLLAWVLGTTRRVHGLADGLHAAHGDPHVPSRLLVRAVTGVIYGIGEATITVWIVIFLYERAHLPMGVAAGALSAFWLTMTAGRFLAAAAVRRLPALGLTLALSLGMAASFLLVARSQGPAGAMLACGFAGLCCSAIFPLLLSLGSSEYPDRTPQVSALFSAAVLGGLAIGAFGVGPLRGMFGLVRIYTFSAIGPLGLAGLLLVLRRSAPD